MAILSAAEIGKVWVCIGCSGATIHHPKCKIGQGRVQKNDALVLISQEELESRNDRAR